jgi:hypothetical protein
MVDMIGAILRLLSAETALLPKGSEVRLTMGPFTATCLCLGLGLSALHGAGPESTSREASIVEEKGSVYRVRDLRVGETFDRFSIQQAPADSLLVYTDPLRTCVPLSALLSLEKTTLKRPKYAAGFVYSVVYLVDSRTETIVGGLHRPGAGVPELAGSTRIADQEATYKNNVYQVRKLTFPKDTAQPFMLSSQRKDLAVLVCLDGRRIPVWNLTLYSNRYSTEGYLIGGRTLHAHDASIGIGGGSVSASLAFSQLNRIVFHPKGKDSSSKYASTVIAVKGGEYPSESYVPMIFAGEFAGGRFAVESDALRQIEFTH